MEKLTQMEALTTLFIIKLGRSSGKGFVSVDELAKAMKRSKSRVRTILKGLEKKGVVVGRAKVDVDSEELEKMRRDENLGGLDELFKMLVEPRAGIEKVWELAEVNVLNDDEVRKFLKSREEFEKYFGITKVSKFLGI